jgi:hypothetical protein
MGALLGLLLRATCMLTEQCWGTEGFAAAARRFADRARGLDLVNAESACDRAPQAPQHWRAALQGEQNRVVADYDAMVAALSAAPDASLGPEPRA